MIRFVLQVLHETTLNRQIEEMLETEIVSFLETAKLESGNGEKEPVYQAAEKVVQHVITLIAVNDLLNKKLDKLANRKTSFNPPTSNLKKHVMRSVLHAFYETACAGFHR